jgi:transposase-like protein
MGNSEENQGYQQSFHLVKDTYSQIQEFVLTKMRNAALKMALELFEQEVNDLCGDRFSRKSSGQCHRGGSDDGRILLHGQRVQVKKPRVRKADEEVQLQSYSALTDYDMLCDRVMKHMLSGVSTRRYDGLLEEVAGGTGLKKSSVSRAFKKGSQEALNEINSRDLSKLEFIAVMVDGIEFGDRCVIAALGITTKGQKMIIGLREGDTENSEVVKDLMQSFFDRGLQTVIPPLFVVDGSKALKKAIRKVFGQVVPIQRCVRHKERNVISYLPKAFHQEFRRRWKKLHGYTEFESAKKEYSDLVTWLSRINYAAAQSLEEAEMETLTVVKLKVPGLLRKTLLSTNPIESAFSCVESGSRRVKNWKSGQDQVSRWAAVTLLEAEKQFRTVKGHQQIPLLIEELRNLLLENKIEIAV